VFADLVTCYTNSADILDILAPSNNAHTTDVNGGYFPTFSGTSCASPYAAGAAAVLQSWAIATQGAPLAPSEIRDILVTYGDPVEDPKNGLIRPRINLGNFLDAGEDCNDGVDNDGDGDVDCDDFDCQVDSDGDTVLDPPCGTDCDIDDDTVWTVPADPTRLRWLDRNTIAWTAPDYGAGGASAFQLVQGRLEELPVGSGPAEQCLDPAIGDVQATDPTLPASGDRFYYLVRGTNACIAADHPYGQDSAGGQRTTAACP
jgi:hypothetical protein